MNKVLATGNLTRDPELYVTEKGTNVARFTVATDRPKSKASDEKKTDFINCVAFDQSAKYITSYAKKGTKVEIEGAYRTDFYESKETGKQEKSVTVAISQVKILANGKEFTEQN